MKKLPLGIKISIWSALVVAVAMGVLGAFTLLFLEHRKTETFDERLRQTCEHYIDQFVLHGSDLAWVESHEIVEIFHPAGTPERFLEITGPDGSILYHTENLTGKRSDWPGAGNHHLVVNGIPTRVAVVSGSGLTIRFAMDMRAISELTWDLAMAYLIAFPFVMAGAWFGGQLIAHKALAPVREVTAAAAQITALNLSRKLPSPGVDDEIGRLTTVLNEMFNRLEVSFRQATRFSADASHELKTPLTVLRSGIEDLLDSKNLPPSAQIALASLLEQTTFLGSIIENLLLLSRMDARQFKLDFVQQDIVETLSACVEDARIMAEPYGLTVQSDLPAALSVPVDRGRLTQIVLNLLDNAIKYNEPHGTVAVKASSSDSFCRITIANTGSANHESNPNLLFERFYRAEHVAEKPGTGLGLSLARELARAHGGDVVLVRSDGKWTEFALTLPLQARQTVA
ncbi:HAMP domain-containing sensor histidine kinase [Roseimicrobium sp. ORNL1]|uniref:HAMP domain-containing sensor histidine kinase n=1 Tax=Roseimicrobium sp. ORNL1 TaxID=2711231 RepID=UPI0013E15849|nr:HAMP domain-containing sensor histidine kinase [Roseimicrobium sp. ORNL1]QIF03814.1 HAMP domain-containing histidine kinase [Roseimicrobium sp. ORNL1]